MCVHSFSLRCSESNMTLSHLHLPPDGRVPATLCPSPMQVLQHIRLPDRNPSSSQTANCDLKHDHAGNGLCDLLTGHTLPNAFPPLRGGCGGYTAAAKSASAQRAKTGSMPAS